jgi:hypothetical protein
MVEEASEVYLFISYYCVSGPVELDNITRNLAIDVIRISTGDLPDASQTHY